MHKDFRFIKSKLGFTLIELLVSISVLVIVSGISVSIFISVIQGQKKIFSDQEAYGQLGYVLEYIGKPLRMAGKDISNAGDCLEAPGRNYLLTRYNEDLGFYTGIKFINQSDNNSCQEFYLDVDELNNLGTIKAIKDGQDPISLTSDKIDIESLGFIINGNIENVILNYSSEDDEIQPRVTILIRALLVSNPNDIIKLQTTISQRNLNIK